MNAQKSTDVKMMIQAMIITINKQDIRVAADTYCKKSGGGYSCPSCGHDATIKGDYLICGTSDFHFFDTFKLIAKAEKLTDKEGKLTDDAKITVIKIASKLYGVNGGFLKLYEKLMTKQNQDTTPEGNVKSVQNFKNLPAEILAQPRFFKVGKDKTPHVKGWSETKNQKPYTEINGLAGFDTSGHGFATDYLFLDFDHVLNADGNFVDNSVEDMVGNLQLTFKNIYIEKSISVTGLHVFLIPTEGEFKPICFHGKDAFYFTDDHSKGSPKLEIFYKTSARYCLLTGNKYDDGDEIPRGEKVDVFLKNILADIQKQTPEKVEKNISPVNHKEKFDDPPEYIRDLAVAFVDAIDFANLERDQWLPVLTALKAEGFSKEETRAMCQCSDRYNEKHFDSEFDSITNFSGYGIKTLIGKAKIFEPNFNIGAFKREWYNDHPEYASKYHDAKNDFDNISDDSQIDSLRAELQAVNKKLADFDAEKTAAIEKLKSAEHFDKDFVFSDEILPAAAFASIFDKKVFSDFKAAIQNQITMSKGEKFVKDEWLPAVKDKVAEIKDRQADLLAQKNNLRAKIATLDFFAAHDELKGLSGPDGYKISNTGIEKLVGDKSLTVSRAPAVILGKSKNVEDKTFKLILAYLAENGTLQSVRATGEEIIFNARKLIDLRAFGLPVTSTNANLFVDYLDAFKAVNEKNLPMSFTVSRCGWHNFNGQDYFVDPRRNNFISDETHADRNFEVFVEDSSTFAKSLKSVGSLDEWRRAYDLAKKSPVARLIVAASIAAPLLKIFDGERNFLLYVHAPTRAGKTTALYLGASAVGDEKIIRSFDATKNGLAGAAADVNDYAFLIDEKQVADNRLKDQFDALVYSLANGIGRTKLNRDSTLKKLQDWRTIAIMTGETVLFDDNVTGGAYSRLISIQAPKEIISADDCREIRQIIKKNYGLVLPLFVDELFKYGLENIREKYQEIYSRCTKNFSAVLPEYCRYIALISIADILLNMCLGLEKNTCITDTNVFAQKIFELVPTIDEISDTEREKDFVLGFIAEKSAHFENSFSFIRDYGRDIYGKFDDDGFVYLTARALKTACEDSRFDYKKLVADLVGDKFFIPDDKIRSGRKSPYSFVQKKICGVKNNCYRIPKQFTVDVE